MHIPSSTTAEIEVLSFEDALVPSKEEKYDRARWLYVPDFYSEYRYILGTRGKRPLICIGINPSTAEPDNLDNTLKSAERIALANGFDSFIMFNVYAQRATDPDDMEKEFNPHMHRENMKAFEYILSLSEGAPAVWAAWGTIIEKRAYLRDCVLDMIELGERYGAQWFTAGSRSKKKGHPHHPLYLRKDSCLDPFDAKTYCISLSDK
ncbi:MAG: DUF1643 domain-containing protein [Ruminococcaceae bacterium]|nr:DUF1643 domain-containing protein [Oscillospiraceae bacterium]